ncbi:MAG: DsbA family protein [Methyloceanibacter sp.]
METTKPPVRTKPPKQTASAGDPTQSKTGLYVVAALVAVAVVGGLAYFFTRDTVRPVDGDHDVAVLLTPGPLEDIVLGSPDAPNTIVEYASMTCGHCANFHTKVFPELKKKYIDTGQVRFILREFPLDGLATAAFMLARCGGADRYHPMVEGLFETQTTWAVQGAEGKEKLLLIAKQAGFSQERFDQCLADKELFDKIVEVRQRGHVEFGVESTPTFFINGKRLKGGQNIQQFDAVLAGKEPPEEEPHDHDDDAG